jgi:hypothetical protein
VPDPAPKNPPQQKPATGRTPREQTTDAFARTLRQAEAGDKAALVRVRGWLAAPGVADIMKGNLAREAVRTLVENVSPNPVIREAITRKLDELRSELSGANPSALEKLLVERVVATWLHLHHLEMIYAARENMPLSVGLYFQKSISAAQKRYIAAIKGLAEVRKLALPVLQLNLARKQVNIAGTVVGTPAD